MKQKNSVIYCFRIIPRAHVPSALPFSLQCFVIIYLMSLISL